MPTSSWSGVAAAQAGVVTRAQLRAAGLSDDAVDHLLARHRLTPLARGVHLAAGAPRSARARVGAIGLATGGVLAYSTALWWWGMTAELPPPVHVVVAPERRVAVPRGARVHRQALPVGAVTVHREVRVTVPAWTVVDCGSRLPLPDAVRLADRALQRGWIRADAVRERLSSCPGRRGNARLRQVQAVVADGAAAESERLLHRAPRSARVTGWEPNLAVRVDDRLIAVVDVAFRAARLAVEVDGLAWHVDVDRFQRDRRRQNALVAAGWTVLRFTWQDITTHPGAVVAAIRGQLATATATATR